MLSQRRMQIGPDLVTDSSDCYVIAEIGHNHQGSLEQCKKLFAAAKECGANAVKLQKRDNKALYTKAFFDKPYVSENSYGPTYGLHREALEFNAEQYRELQLLARELNITFFSTAFDFESADFLAALDMQAYKVASGDLTNLPLIRYVAAFRKPMVISTGGAELPDIHRAVNEIYKYHDQLAILQCTSGYPCPYEELNLRVIDQYRKEFPKAIIGFSGHDNGIAMAVAAYALGSRMVEKHFTLDRALKGTDHAFSLERPGLQKMVRDLKRARLALGDGVKRRFASEVAPLTKMAKSLVAARPIAAGTVITRADVAVKSPGDGMPPFELDRIIGTTCSAALQPDDGITYEMVNLAPPTEGTPAVLAAPFRKPVTLADKAAAVRLTVFDFDGVFTDNKVYVSQDGTESVACSRGDGMGVGLLKAGGVAVAVVSTEANPVVAARCRKLEIPCQHGVKDKLAAVKALAAEHKVGLEHVCYVGNDVNDKTCLEAVGVPVVVKDSVAEVLPLAVYTTLALGGQGAVREVCDWLLKHKADAASVEADAVTRKSA